MTPPPPSEPRDVIRASEVGAYVYCAHAWWLGAVEGVPPDVPHRLEAGWAAHETHGQRVFLAALWTRLAQLLLVLAALAGVAWVISSSGG